MSINNVEKWGVYEVSLNGPSSGNPYLDVSLKAEFFHTNKKIVVSGFYDGEGIYKVRFMPDEMGEWHFKTFSDTEALDKKAGRFCVTEATKNNHGPVRVKNKFHFEYSDGKPFLSIGTTCYAWTHQALSEQEKTLESLTGSGFNKVRMGVFPKDYPYNVNEPLYEVFDDLNFDTPNYDYFKHLDRQVLALMTIGIEADLILFHPYDRWGYCNMSREQDLRYVKYVTSRYSGFRNIWWAVANEYDFLIDSKPMALWDEFFKVIIENDSYGHLKSIHNGEPDANYDHTKSWVTHTCIQNWDVKRTIEWRKTWGKPVVNDEPEYEGNLTECWGNISASELTHRFWITMLKGGYAGHGETYSHEEDLIWWAKGGVLRGEAWKRIAFLRTLLERDTVNGFDPIDPDGKFPWNRISGAIDGDVRYIYFGEHHPKIWALGLPKDNSDYDLELIDTWEMTVTKIEPVTAPRNHPVRNADVIHSTEPHAAFAVELPQKTGLAIRCKKRG